MRVSFVPRDEPLLARACLGRGAVARALGRALLEWDDARLSGVAACAGPDVLVVLGETESLPWVEGVEYLGRDEAAPHLLLPTNRAPDVPVELFARALALRVPEAAGRAAVAPGADGSLSVVPVAGAGPVARARLAAWLQGDAS